jgi:hypothetical protein
MESKKKKKWRAKKTKGRMEMAKNNMKKNKWNVMVVWVGPLPYRIPAAAAAAAAAAARLNFSRPSAPPQ